MSMPPPHPLPLREADSSELARIRGVCLDIDDTLSTHGKLTARAFDSLWKLRDAGFAVVPITGRPAGWCDHFARFWPVQAVVGENGAFTFFMQNGVRKRLDTPSGMASSEAQSRLSALGRKIRERFPDARWASDQPYREHDLAVDICEDVPAWSASDVDELLRLCAAEGAHAKLSSIHLNAWFGDYDKRRGFEHWLSSGAPGCFESEAPPPQASPQSPQKALMLQEWLFIGDSPNDEPMFAAFRSTVGVANLSRYLPKLKTPPRWITPSESGEGFAEMTEALIAAKN